MSDSVQFVAGRSGELGVQGQYLDGELHFVDDALAGTVARAEKFEIFRSIFCAVPVYVMDGFFGQQRPSDNFGHNIAVFHNRVFFPGHETGNRNPDVAVSFDVTTKISSLKFFQSARSLVCGFALLIAVFLLFVYTAARLTPFWIFLAAFKAYESIARFACFAASYARTLAGAVPRIACIFLVVCIDKRLHHGKFFAAFATSEFYDGLSDRKWFFEAVSAPAREAAIFPVFARKAGKRLLAVFTDFLNRHRLVPLFGDEGTLSMSFGIVK